MREESWKALKRLKLKVLWKQGSEEKGIKKDTLDSARQKRIKKLKDLKSLPTLTTPFTSGSKNKTKQNKTLYLADGKGCS